MFKRDAIFIEVILVVNAILKRKETAGECFIECCKSLIWAKINLMTKMDVRANNLVIAAFLTVLLWIVFKSQSFAFKLFSQNISLHVQSEMWKFFCWLFFAYLFLIFISKLKLYKKLFPRKFFFLSLQKRNDNKNHLLTIKRHLHIDAVADICCQVVNYEDKQNGNDIRLCVFFIANLFGVYDSFQLQFSHELFA